MIFGTSNNTTITKVLLGHSYIIIVNLNWINDLAMSGLVSLDYMDTNASQIYKYVFRIKFCKTFIFEPIASCANIYYSNLWLSIFI